MEKKKKKGQRWRGKGQLKGKRMGSRKIADPEPQWWHEFAVEYLKNGENAVQAYLKVQPHVTAASASVLATRLLTNVVFLRVFRMHKAQGLAAIALNRDEWFKRMADAVRFDLRTYLKLRPDGDLEMVENWQEKGDGHVIERLKVNTTETDGERPVTRRIFEIRGPNKLRALEVLGKALGIYTESLNVVSDGEPVAVVGLPPLNPD